MVVDWTGGELLFLKKLGQARGSARANSQNYRHLVKSRVAVCKRHYAKNLLGGCKQRVVQTQLMGWGSRSLIPP